MKNSRSLLWLCIAIVGSSVGSSALGEVWVTDPDPDPRAYPTPWLDGHNGMARGYVTVDIDGDAASDLYIEVTGNYYAAQFLIHAGVASLGGAQLSPGEETYFGTTLNILASGEAVDSNQTWYGAPVNNPAPLYHYPVPWLYGPDDQALDFSQGYIGVRLDKADGPHFAWVELARIGDGVNALCWAWEDQPNTPILTPEPGSLSLLLLGGLALLRRRSSK